MSDHEQDLGSVDASRPDPVLRAEVDTARRSKLWLAPVCGAAGVLIGALSVILLRPTPPVASPWASNAPAVATAASVTPEPVRSEPVRSEAVGKTEVIVAHEESLTGLAIRGGKIYYLDEPELGQDNGYIKVASVDRLQQGTVRARGAMFGVVSGDRATCFFDDKAIQCDGGAPGRFDAHGSPADVVVRGDAVYWLTDHSADSDTGALWVRRGASERQLIGGLTGFGRLAVNSGTAYYAMCHGNSFDDCVIESIDIEGGYHQVLEASRGDVHAMAVDQHEVYWIDRRRREIRGMNGAAGKPWTVASNLEDPRAIAIDKDHVYWTDYAAGTISRASKSGDEVTLLAAHQKGPIGIALDGTHVYWCNLNEGTIRRTEKLPVE